MATAVVKEREEEVARECQQLTQEIAFFSLPLDQCRALSLNILLQSFSASSPRYTLQQLSGFISKVQLGYPENPFHNFYHATAVLQNAHIVITTTNRGRSLSPELKLACLLAAFCHDIGHRGFTNTFEHNRALLTHSQLDSVLEKMHVSLTTQLLLECDMEITSRMRKVICEAIMGTDMKLHSSFVGQVASQRLQLDDDFLVSGIVKLSDLSSQTYGFDQAELWGRRITQEFNNQVMWEDALGMDKPSVPFCELEHDFYSGQVFFIKTFALPLWETVCQVCPELVFKQQQLGANLSMYAAKASNPSLLSLTEEFKPTRRTRNKPPTPQPVVFTPPYHYLFQAALLTGAVALYRLSVV
ncbi:hypothetical protein BASA81_015599 [Batrachochytrium salamandrivorans]|nr:hypothetical protein BASA81_015599 [Batrachochytrium salamandrivorans]